MTTDIRDFDLQYLLRQAELELEAEEITAQVMRHTRRRLASIVVGATLLGLTVLLLGFYLLALPLTTKRHKDLPVST
jgi:hypothetical protein